MIIVMHKPSKTIINAQKRAILQRFLIKHCVDFDVHDSTECLMTAVKIVKANKNKSYRKENLELKQKITSLEYKIKTIKKFVHING